MQKLSQKCKIKVAKFHSIICWSYGVIGKTPKGVEFPGVVWVNKIINIILLL